MHHTLTREIEQNHTKCPIKTKKGQKRGKEEK